MAFDGIPLNWEILSLVAGAAGTGAAAAWAISQAVTKAGARELEARLIACTQKSSTLGTDLEKETLKVERLEGRLKERDRTIETLESAASKTMSEGNLEIMEELKSRVHNFDRLRDALLGADDEVWKLRETQQPPDFDRRMRESKPKIITVVNYKGGVGKTTVVAGLAAYLANRRKRVLLIDFDYQGSLTRTLILGARLPLGSQIRADSVIGGKIDGPQLINMSRDLGGTLPGANLITCGQTFDGFEYRTMLHWLLGETKDDVRYRLATLLLSNAVQSEYDYVLIDAPPRASTGAINALCASHAIVVPTVLDSLSVDAAASFLSRANASFRSLNPALDFAGIVGTLTKATNLNDAEEKAMGDAKLALPLWGGRSHLFQSRIRHFVALSRSAGRDLGYLNDRAVKRAFDALGDELIRKLHESTQPPEHLGAHGSAARAGWRDTGSEAAASIQQRL
jgi:cellulose biosynthesis protein BcsQ